ncbi:NACHT domain-containing protein [Streptomyces sp. NPDC058108]|uniref:NACHT domain-containing protein n=1 Tax=Streptomyces sp. NPDC058108 TaxID=3346344 RepID=UPI0036E645C2
MTDATTGQGNYLYERLTEKNFQRLCAALLAHVHPDARCYPVGHSDGGRDMTRTNATEAVVYQVKWTSKAAQNPVSWLSAAIREEADNIRQLVRDGATRYVLITSVAGTAVPGRGSMDRLDAELTRFKSDFNIPMQVWWRSDVDARVDAAPTELKWAYSDMLAGHDLVRYFIHGAQAAAQDQELRTLVMKVIATQWEEDSKVKFKQVELTTHNLDDLFVDVGATRVSEPSNLRRPLPVSLDLGQDPADLAGAADYLMRADRPFTLVRGEPGQGKSTLSQYLCQRHRAAYLNEADESPDGPATPEQPADPRIALRIDLHDYAAWLAGQDPFADDMGTAKKRLRRDGQLEQFLAAFLTAHGGGLPAEAATVHDLLDRLPVLVVLDGLDEVASPTTRKRVVSEINTFTARLRTAFNAQLIVTTRPNASELAEPSKTLFETITLTRLSPELRNTYLHKWARARGISGPDLVELERTFKQRSAEPHIAQLADNPMQLTILLFLMQRRANSVPNSRTALYTSYMETFLDREAEKTATVHEHRADLEEVTAFLGWHLQARAEAENGNGQMPTRELLKAVMNYLFDVDKDESMFNDLFTAVTDRVWALTSKVQGTFEFDVQPLREYFAARYLYEYAGADRRGFDTGEVLRNMVRRGYWLNTMRFYAGFANPNELGGMVEALEEEWDARLHPNQVRIAAWNLLADGVFIGRKRSQNRAAELFLDDLSVRLIRHNHTYVHEPPEVAGDRGGHHLAAGLRALVDKKPASRATAERIQLASRLDDPAEFDTWWQSHMLSAARTENERTWLEIAAPTQSLARAGAAVVNRLALADPATAAAALAAGAVAEPDSSAEHTLLRAVLDGHASDITHPCPGYVGDVLRVLRPDYYIRKAWEQPDSVEGRETAWAPQHQRHGAFRRLRDRDPRFALLQQKAKNTAGQANTTSIWGNTARAVSELFGPCWLAAEIAIIGAAANPKTLLTGGDLTRDSECFGSRPDYGRLLQETRRNRAEPAWWTETFTTYTDPLSRAVWVLALLSTATQDTLLEHVEHVDDAISKIPDEMLSALRLSSSRLGAMAFARPLSEAVLAAAADRSLATINLLTHHVPSEQFAVLDESTLINMARYGGCAWPALHALTERMAHALTPQLMEGLRAYGPYPQGPFGRPLHVRGDVLNDAPEAVTTILDAPFDYPIEWVLAAVAATERSALATDASHLQDVAREQNWFTHQDS